jgi:hypothetical protein
MYDSLPIQKFSASGLRDIQFIHLSIPPQWESSKVVTPLLMLLDPIVEKGIEGILYRQAMCLCDFLLQHFSLIETWKTPKSHTLGGAMTRWHHLGWRGPMEHVPCVTKKQRYQGLKGVEYGWHVSPQNRLPCGTGHVINQIRDSGLQNFPESKTCYPWDSQMLK